MQARATLQALRLFLTVHVYSIYIVSSADGYFVVVCGIMDILHDRLTCVLLRDFLNDVQEFVRRVHRYQFLIGLV